MPIAIDGFVAPIVGAANKLSPRGESEDVAQEALLRFWQWAESNPDADADHLGAMANRIVAQTAADFGRRSSAARRDRRRNVAIGSIEPAAKVLTPLDEVSVSEAVAIIREHVEALPKSLATVMVDYLFGVTARSEDRGKRSRAKVALQESLSESGLAPGV